MSQELSMVAMLAITAGAALYIAWPLMFGGARPEDFLELPDIDLRTRGSISIGGSISDNKKNELELDPGSKPRADLDVELEIEAFRRHTRDIKARDDRTGGQ